MNFPERTRLLKVCAITLVSMIPALFIQIRKEPAHISACLISGVVGIIAGYFNWRTIRKQIRDDGVIPYYSTSSIIWVWVMLVFLILIFLLIPVTAYDLFVSLMFIGGMTAIMFLFVQIALLEKRLGQKIIMVATREDFLKNLIIMGLWFLAMATSIIFISGRRF